MSLNHSKNDAKKDQNYDENNKDILQQASDQAEAGTPLENDQVKKELDYNKPDTWDQLPVNISINQIDEIFTKIDKVPFNEHNYIAVINYLQTYHFALAQLEGQLKSANNTIQAYEEDIRAFNESGATISKESNEYFLKAKKLEDTQKTLLEYINTLRQRYINDVSKRFAKAFAEMKEADDLSNQLISEFRFTKSEKTKPNKDQNGENMHNVQH